VGKATAQRLLKKHPEQDQYFNMCSIALKGSSVVSYGYNRYRTDPVPIQVADRYHVKTMYPTSKDIYVSPHLHAEVAALKRAQTGVDTLVVVRLTHHGCLANARPCNVCVAVMRDYGVKQVIYSVDGGMTLMPLDSMA
jgi:deoxycytidylate deaminase